MNSPYHHGARRTTPPRPGDPTPWGDAQHVDRYPHEGVYFVSTAGHGGFWLDAGALAELPESARSADGWYEEDCEAVLVLVAFPWLFPHVSADQIAAWLDEYAADHSRELGRDEGSYLAAARQGYACPTWRAELERRTKEATHR